MLNRDAEIVRLLMEAGADARKGIYPHRDATAAITIARERGYDDIVAIIEEEERRRREALSCPNATVSPVQDRISEAIRNHENAEAVSLLESDASLLRACDRDGNSPLHVAAGNVECEDTTSYGCRTTIETLLWGACNAGDAEMVAMCMPFIQRGPDDVWWSGMLEQPMRRGEGKTGDHPACLKLMLDTGVNANVTRRFRQRALHFLCARVNDPQAQAAFGRTLLDAGARLDVRDDILKSTPLAWACRWGRIELVKLFIERGAAVNEPDAEPWATPLAWAQKMGHGEIVALLKQNGAVETEARP